LIIFNETSEDLIILEINLYGFEKTFPVLPFFDILQINLSRSEKTYPDLKKNLSRFEMVLCRTRLSSTFYQSKIILKHLSLSSFSPTQKQDTRDNICKSNVTPFVVQNLVKVGPVPNNTAF
jgi:hypothetical protein